MATTRKEFGTKFPNSVQSCRKIFQTRPVSGQVVYEEPQSYKAYHLFLIQNLCIHAGIGFQELAMGKNFYSIHKLLRAYC